MKKTTSFKDRAGKSKLNLGGTLKELIQNLNLRIKPEDGKVKFEGNYNDMQFQGIADKEKIDMQGNYKGVDFTLSTTYQAFSDNIASNIGEALKNNAANINVDKDQVREIAKGILTAITESENNGTEVSEAVQTAAYGGKNYHKEKMKAGGKTKYSLKSIKDKLLEKTIPQITYGSPGYPMDIYITDVSFDEKKKKYIVEYDLQIKGKMDSGHTFSIGVDEMNELIRFGDVDYTSDNGGYTHIEGVEGEETRDEEMAIGGKIISKDKAKEISSNWHGGQNSALYQYSSSGTYLPENHLRYLQEVQKSLDYPEQAPHPYDLAKKDERELNSLKRFFEYKGEENGIKTEWHKHSTYGYPIPYVAKDTPDEIANKITKLKYLVKEGGKMKDGAGVGGYEYKTVDTRTEKGLKEAEKLQSEGWKMISGNWDRMQFERPNPNLKDTTVFQAIRPITLNLIPEGGTIKLTEGETVRGIITNSIGTHYTVKIISDSRNKFASIPKNAVKIKETEGGSLAKERYVPAGEVMTGQVVLNPETNNKIKVKRKSVAGKKWTITGEAENGKIESFTDDWVSIVKSSGGSMAKGGEVEIFPFVTRLGGGEKYYQLWNIQKKEFLKKKFDTKEEATEYAKNNNLIIKKISSGGSMATGGGMGSKIEVIEEIQAKDFSDGTPYQLRIGKKGVIQDYVGDEVKIQLDNLDKVLVHKDDFGDYIKVVKSSGGSMATGGEIPTWDYTAGAEWSPNQVLELLTEKAQQKHGKTLDHADKVALMKEAKEKAKHGLDMDSIYEILEDYLPAMEVMAIGGKISESVYNKAGEYLSFDGRKELESDLNNLIEQSKKDGSVMIDNIVTPAEEYEYIFTVDDFLYEIGYTKFKGGPKADQGGSMARGGQANMTRTKSYYQALPEYKGYKWKGFWDGYHHFVKKEDKGFMEVRALDKDIDDGSVQSMIDDGVSRRNGASAGNAATFIPKSSQVKKLGQQIESLEKSLKTEIINQMPDEKAKMEKSLKALKAQYADLSKKVSAKEKMNIDKGKFFLTIPSEYKEPLYQKLRNIGIKVKWRELDGTTKAIANSQKKLNKIYGAYAGILKKENKEVPSIESISGKH